MRSRADPDAERKSQTIKSVAIVLWSHAARCSQFMRQHTHTLDKAAAFSREELYNLVWSTPMMRLAEMYDISDVGLAKTCRRLRVPRPPVGYWQRLAAGQKVPRPKLSPIPRGLEGGPTVAYLMPRVEVPEEPISLAMQRVAEFEAAPEHRIEVPADLRSAPEVVKYTARELRARPRRTPLYLGGIQRTPARDILDVRTTDASLTRALRLMAGLVRGLEKRGLSVVADPPTRGPVAELWQRDQGHSWNRDGWRPPLTLVLFPDEYVRLTLRELMTKAKPSETPGTLRPSEPSVGRGLFVLSATFSVGDSSPDQVWKETPNRKLEELLNDVVVGLFALVEDRREKRARWAEEARQRAVAEARRWRREHRRSRVVERDDRHVKEAQAWTRAKQLMEYAEAVASLGAQLPAGPSRERRMRDAARLRRTARRANPLEL